MGDLTNFKLFFGPTLESFKNTRNWSKLILGTHFFVVWAMSHSIFSDLNFGSFCFCGFEFRVILFFWVVKIYDRTSIPVKEMLVCPALGLVGCLNSFSFNSNSPLYFLLDILPNFLVQLFQNNLTKISVAEFIRVLSHKL